MTLFARLSKHPWCLRFSNRLNSEKIFYPAELLNTGIGLQVLAYFSYILIRFAYGTRSFSSGWHGSGLMDHTSIT